MSAPVPAPGPRGPIFIQGIYRRSGTNHLLNLLCVHPDCAPADPIWEDHLLAHAEHLERYVRAVSGSWNPKWGAGQRHADALRAALGGGIEAFLQALAGPRRVVTKTPSVDQLQLFPALFPGATLLILVRDGRAVVESGVRSFGWYRDKAIHGWAKAARAVLRFDAEQRGGPLRYRMVRYEDLVAEPESTLRELLSFLELDPSRYDFEKALSLPVRGSSSLVQGREDRVHWNGSPADAGFDPLSRFAHWSRRRHARFNWIAGDALAGLGYAPRPAGGGLLSDAWNRLLDRRTGAALRLRPALLAWRRLRKGR
jgi:hypothetical protein